jgi:Domain of unknown function (DUF4440)
MRDADLLQGGGRTAMRMTVCAMVLISSIGSGVAGAQDGAAEVGAVLAEVMAATQARDAGRLASCIDERFAMWNARDGQVTGRDAVVAQMVAGPPPADAKLGEPTVRMYGDVATASVELLVPTRPAGEPRACVDSVLVRGDGRWRMVCAAWASPDLTQPVLPGADEPSIEAMRASYRDFVAKLQGTTRGGDRQFLVDAMDPRGVLVERTREGGLLVAPLQHFIDTAADRAKIGVTLMPAPDPSFRVGLAQAMIAGNVIDTFGDGTSAPFRNIVFLGYAAGQKAWRVFGFVAAPITVARDQ